MSSSPRMSDESVDERRQRAIEIVKRRQSQSNPGAVFPSNFTTPLREPNARSIYYADSFEDSQVSPRNQSQSGVIETPQRMSVAKLRASFSRGSSQPVMPGNSSFTPGKYSYTPSRKPWNQNGTNQNKEEDKVKKENQEESTATTQPLQQASRPWHRNSISTKLDTWQKEANRKSVNSNYAIEIEETKSNESVSPPGEIQPISREKTDNGEINTTESFEGNTKSSSEAREQVAEIAVNTQSSNEDFHDENVTAVVATPKYDVLAAELFPVPSIEETSLNDIRREKTLPEHILQQMSKDSSLYLEDMEKSISPHSVQEILEDIEKSISPHSVREIEETKEIPKEDPVPSSSTEKSVQLKIQALRPPLKDHNSYRTAYYGHESPRMQHQQIQSKSTEESQFESPFLAKECGSSYESIVSQEQSSPEDSRDDLADRDERTERAAGDPEVPTQLKDSMKSPHTRERVSKSQLKMKTPKESNVKFPSKKKSETFDPFADSDGWTVKNAEGLFTPFSDPFMTEEIFSPPNFATPRGKISTYVTSPAWDIRQEV